jgi:hypothetical protein
MLVIIVYERDLVEYLERHFNDADNDNYARLIKNYPQLLEDYVCHTLKCQKTYRKSKPKSH